jgi:hypothetical protein
VPKEFPVIESMTLITKNPFRIRVWRGEEQVRDYYPETEAELRQALLVYFDTEEKPGRAGIARILAKVSRVGAVEVTVAGVGLVVYTEWP